MGKIDRDSLKKSIAQKKRAVGKIVLKCQECKEGTCHCQPDFKVKDYEGSSSRN